MANDKRLGRHTGQPGEPSFARVNARWGRIWACHSHGRGMRCLLRVSVVLCALAWRLWHAWPKLLRSPAQRWRQANHPCPAAWPLLRANRCLALDIGSKSNEKKLRTSDSSISTHCRIFAVRPLFDSPSARDIIAMSAAQLLNPKAESRVRRAVSLAVRGQGVLTVVLTEAG